ncbi:hypothetical protein [Lysobacter sp. ESA13C]|uniref:hypothetical protein n=1 Tax=Lysobacter sp. ESA13C TaxID=2862676 RepID=UPI001CC0EAD8|nr:hypothetical protein [Lysobacter sp. ESA13C]
MRIISFFVLWLIFFGSGFAQEGGDVRPLEEVFAESEYIFFGAVVGSGVGPCAGYEDRRSYYIIRVTEVTKGRLEKSDVKACGDAPLLLSNRYLVAANKHPGGDIVFEPDAVLLVFPFNEFYRLISFDGPVVASDRGDAYAVGLLEPNFIKRFGTSIGMKKRCHRSSCGGSEKARK